MTKKQEWVKAIIDFNNMFEPDGPKLGELITQKQIDKLNEIKKLEEEIKKDTEEYDPCLDCYTCREIDNEDCENGGCRDCARLEERFGK